MPNKEALVRYGELKIEAKRIEDELELIRATALAEAAAIRGDEDRPVQLKEFPGYNFTIQTRKKWKYSPLTEERIKQVEEKKKEEQASGDATYDDGEPYLVFSQPKE